MWLYSYVVAIATTANRGLSSTQTILGFVAGSASLRRLDPAYASPIPEQQPMTNDK